MGIGSLDVLKTDNAIAWSNLSKLCAYDIPWHRFGFPAEHKHRIAPNVISHCKFVTIIQSIWTANQAALVTKSLHTIFDLQAVITRSSQVVTDLQAEVDRLKQKNADLSYQVQLTAYSLQLLQPVSPVYDYKEIKSRKQKLHWEFKRLSKLMKLG
jgi:FtsZ-binding cell division protein ZapB